MIIDHLTVGYYLEISILRDILGDNLWDIASKLSLKQRHFGCRSSQNERSDRNETTSAELRLNLANFGQLCTSKKEQQGEEQIYVWFKHPYYFNVTYVTLVWHFTYWLNIKMPKASHCY